MPIVAENANVTTKSPFPISLCFFPIPPLRNPPAKPPQTAAPAPCTIREMINARLLVAKAAPISPIIKTIGP